MRWIAIAAVLVVGACRGPSGPQLPTFACGETSCTVAEYCGHYSGGAVDRETGEAPHSDSCDPIPSACTQTPTCDCLRGAGVAFTSCDDGGGHPAISVLAP